MHGSKTEKRPIPRKDAFFGLHFDLHPGYKDRSLGADVTEENISKLLKRVKPDYVQYDCKGHAGYTGYPTKIGWPSPGIVKDSLEIWRKVTREHGVGLFIHYSGVWDIVACEHHKDWARIDEKGEVDLNATSTFGPYVDKLLIPQLNEVISKYQLDGVWADGECWGAKLDYSPMALEAWKKETGYDDAPKDRSDARWLQWKMFHRRQFEKYLCYWVDEVHKSNPGVQLTSNWMYTTYAPKPIVAKLDFLSGDYTPHGSVDSARCESRYLANTGMPWDLMAWGFNNGDNLGASLKPAVHLQQEAGIVLMQGGGFQIYYNPTRSGHLADVIINTAGEVADFCRARQKVSHKSTSVPQVALLLSSETQWDKSDDVFASWGDTLWEIQGALHALLENHYSVDVLAEHQLAPKIRDYPLLVIPDAYKLTDEFKKTVLEYVKSGGRLLLMGQKCAELFKPALGVEFEGRPRQSWTEVELNGNFANANGIWQKVRPTTAKPIGYRYQSRDNSKGKEIAATINDYGKGKVAAIYGPVPWIFYKGHHPYLRQFIGSVVQQVFPDPDVEIDGLPSIDIALRRTKEGNLSLHLLNTTNAPHGLNYSITDFIPEVGPIQVKMKVAEKPKRVTWVPDGGRLKWSWENGVLSITVPKLHVHGVVVVEKYP